MSTGSGPHTPIEDHDSMNVTHEIVVDTVDGVLHEGEEFYTSEERHRSRGDDEDSYRNRRRRTSSRSQSPPVHRRSRTPPRRSRSPRRDRRSRSPRLQNRPQAREGADSYRPSSRRASNTDHYEPEKRERDGERIRESHRSHRDRRERTHSRDRIQYRSSSRSERNYGGRLTPRETAAIAASQRSQKECRVYVGNLAYEVKWGQLKDFMRQAGEVVFADVLLQANGMSKGCGVVEFRTPEEARRSIDTLNDTLLLGRPIFIREDRELEAKFVNGLNLATGSEKRAAPHQGSSSGYKNSNSNSNNNHNNNTNNHTGNTGRQVFVGNLPYSVGWQELKDLFRNAGNVIRADILIGHDGRSKGSGTVLFETPRDATNSISMYDGYEWNNRRIEVREDRFAGGPPPPRFAGRPNSRPFSGSSYGGAGSNSGFYGSSTTAAYGSSYSSSLNAPSDQYEGYGTGSYNEFGSGVGIMDFGGNGFGGGYSGPYGGGASFEGSSGFFAGASTNPNGGGSGSQIFVRNLPFTTTNLDLRDLFKHCGNVMRTEILEQGGRPKGAGIVQFETYDSARLAVEKFNGYSYGGRHIDVYFDRFA
ncbi:hypothetical protein G9A89_021483 [Geosiphon pyriformis]|nr:hypothetical protein G9A89_021483 [Geosiphon pyriformis]